MPTCTSVRVLHAHLKTDEGQAALHAELARTDVLITSFRPSALAKLGLGWEVLQVRYPRLSLVRIVGALGERAEEPGHDLTYQAEAGLLAGRRAPPPTLFADMAGALVASEAVLQALLAQPARRWRVHRSGPGRGRTVAGPAAALGPDPRRRATGGAHAGYRIYPCRMDVAVAALEPHFAARLCAAVAWRRRGTLSICAIRPPTKPSPASLQGQTRAQLDALARAQEHPAVRFLRD
jgi:crotonobetainyl-CoA:carnitine CoA-transferase CaiB-like acyl-CoA transferase